MARDFPERYRPDDKIYSKELERIFGSKHKECGWCKDTGKDTETSESCVRGCDLSVTPTSSVVDATTEKD